MAITDTLHNPWAQGSNCEAAAVMLREEWSAQHLHLSGKEILEAAVQEKILNQTFDFHAEVKGKSFIRSDSTELCPTS